VRTHSVDAGESPLESVAIKEIEFAWQDKGIHAAVIA
jgi:hypothetical protein